MNGDMNDKGNIKRQFLRGIQVTGKDGSVGFETLFPGNYFGRTPHIHGNIVHQKKAKVNSSLVATHINITVHPNKTITAGRTPHVGQIYFDQDLLDSVSATHPYSTNKVVRTPNMLDFVISQGMMAGHDPFVEYVMLGKDLKDGVFSWINFAIDPSKKNTISPAVTCSNEGCKHNTGMWDLFGFGPGASLQAPKGKSP